jgi:hypothetical protein
MACTCKTCQTSGNKGTQFTRYALKGNGNNGNNFIEVIKRRSVSRNNIFQDDTQIAYVMQLPLPQPRMRLPLLPLLEPKG